METRDYDDIINLPHHQSEKRPHMGQVERSAQFAPFAALTGHDEACEETAALAESMVDFGVHEAFEEAP